MGSGIKVNVLGVCWYFKGHFVLVVWAHFDMTIWCVWSGRFWGSLNWVVEKDTCIILILIQHVGYLSRKLSFLHTTQMLGWVVCGNGCFFTYDWHVILILIFGYILIYPAKKRAKTHVAKWRCFEVSINANRAHAPLAAAECAKASSEPPRASLMHWLTTDAHVYTLNIKY